MQVYPSQITPGENFDIFFFLRNPTDTAAYYVQAVIYDVRTGKQLTTATLAQSPGNPHLFVATLQAPPDPVSMGRNIVAVASLYTDPAMTQKSPDYEEQEQYFLIKSAPVTFGGGGGVDYGTLREMMQEELAKAVKGLPKPPEAPEMPFDAVFGALGAITREIGRIPKEAGTDLEPLKAQLDAIQQTLAALPSPEKLDLTPVLAALSQLSDQVGSLGQMIATTSARLSQSQEASLRKLAFQLDASIRGNVQDAMANHEFSVSYPSMPASLKSSSSKAPTPAPDVSHLMNV